MKFLKKALEEEGFEYKPTYYNFIPDFIPEGKVNPKLNFFIENFGKDRFNDLLLKVFVEYLVENIKNYKEEEETEVIVFGDKGEQLNKNAYGKIENEVIAIKDGKANGIELGFPLELGNGYMLCNRELEKEVFGCDEKINISILDVVSLTSNKKVYYWRTERIKTFKEPLLALAHAIKEFGIVGGIIKKGKVYPNPIYMVNEKYLEGISKKGRREKEVYEIFKRVKNGAIYFMNFQGDVLAFNKKLEEKENYLGKEVYVEKEILKELAGFLERDVDYYEEDGEYVTQLSTLIGGFINKQESGELILKPFKDGWKVVNNGFRLGDVKVSFILKDKELEVKTSRSCKDRVLLTFTKNYIIGGKEKKYLVSV